MDRLLRPTKLEADPNAPDSKQVFKHWRKTFERFVAAVANDRDVNDPEIDKYGLLINYVSSSVYNYIEETNNYGHAMTLLERAYKNLEIKLWLGIYCQRELNCLGKASTNFF